MGRERGELQISYTVTSMQIHHFLKGRTNLLALLGLDSHRTCFHVKFYIPFEFK